MPHNYAFTTKGVLRQLKWSLLREYGAFKGFLGALPALSSDQEDVAALFDEIQLQPAEIKTEIEEDLRDVYSLGDEAGRRLIYDEAKHQGFDFTDAMTELDSAHDLALWTLLHHHELFITLLQFHSADSLPHRYWRRGNLLSAPEVEVDEALRARLSANITSFLVGEEGRGHHCHVDFLQRSTRVLFVCYPEDYGDTILEYDEDSLVRRKIRPAQDLLFFYTPGKPRLDVFCKGPKKRVASFMQIFALVVLKTLVAEGNAGKAYDLGLLKQRGFSFVIPPIGMLTAIDVRSITLRDRDDGRESTYQVDGHAGNGVVRVLGKFFSTEPGEVTDKYPLYLMDVSRVRLQAYFRPLGKKKRGRTRTFTVTLNGCVLDHEGNDGLIREVLADSHIETEIPELMAV